ncbi:MAG: ATP-binding protein [Lachnospiraceae bacterium]|nr:ATP-binding protein [Lachnospiraceae bacterium]
MTMRKNKKMTAQDSIPFERMFADGICRAQGGFYSKTVEFRDINYILSTDSDKDYIYSGWCRFLNTFGPESSLQLTFVNSPVDPGISGELCERRAYGDGYDRIRDEYFGMLRSKLENPEGHARYSKRKFITFGLKSVGVNSARPLIEKYESEITSSLKKLGVETDPLTGRERLRLIHTMTHMNGDYFGWSQDRQALTGLSQKDAVAPSSFVFDSGKCFRTGDMWASASHFQIAASELSDRVLSDLIDLDMPEILTMHIKPLDQAEAVKSVKRKITDIDKMKIEEQKKASRSGYDSDILPPDLATYGSEARKILENLQSRNEKLFLFTFIVVTMGSSREELSRNLKLAKSAVRKNLCNLMCLDFLQEEGFMSSLPLGRNLVTIERGITTTGAGIFIPFTTRELLQKGSEALYYGTNAVSGNLILCDRKLLKNPNGLILGTPGSGKSFAAKREIANVFLSTSDDILICDPESEYGPVVKRLGGQVLKISQNSKDYINPMDMTPDYSDDNPLSLKSDFILSLMELIVSNRDGLTPVDKTVIDRSVRKVYAGYLRDPRPENMPVLGDLYEELKKQPEPEAAYLATALEIYVSGSLNVFNHRTNIDIRKRIVVFDIKELGKQLKKIGMLIVQDAVWNRLTLNRSRRKSTRYYIDEMHLLLKDEQTAGYTGEIWKRFRKWGGIPTGITQNVKDLLASREIENIFENSDFICMLNQAAGDREILASKLSISPLQLSYVTQSGEGEGLLFYGNTILSFRDRFPKNTMLYSLMTTKPQEAGDAD